MTRERQGPHDHFRALLLTVMGQAFEAAGYHLTRRPLQWAGGKFRFVKAFDCRAYGIIDFQTLIYSETIWASGGQSRFRAQLTRSADASGRMTDDAIYATRGLSQLVVGDFGVPVLPSADYWWSYGDSDSLAHALAEAGHLIVGYGMPWLAGELSPPDS